MKKIHLALSFVFLFLIVQVFILFLLCDCQKNRIDKLHVFEIKEIVLTAINPYDNPYLDVECWIQLKGPNFDKRIYGFWDGRQVFKVRFVATEPGEWSWTSGSNRQDDTGLNGHTGLFQAIEWTDIEKEANPNRRGLVRATPNGHALQYADGSPFFFLGDTWWAASTWRYPLTGKAPDPTWEPGPQEHSFENVIYYRQIQGYNSLAMIACYPNWNTDNYPNQYVDENGIGIRQAWEKFGTPSAKDMPDESGNFPFALNNDGPMANFNKINPAYFQSLDNKMDYLNSVGFVPFLEAIRRDHGPSWKAYFEWPDSFIRYIQYIVARYGAYNLIFSPVHLDWIPPVFSLTGKEFNEAIVAWYNKYGPLPYGQPVTVLIDGATHTTFGTGEETPWLTMHSVGNHPRNHGFYPLLEEQFHLIPPKPTANLEPYYPGWNHIYHNNIAGEMVEPNSDRDNYFGRAQAWGSVFSGSFAGYMYGTGAYDGTTVGEETGSRPFIWEALKYSSGKQVGYVRKFIKSEGAAYLDLQPDSDNLNPRKSANSHPNGLDGWAYMISSPDKNLAMLYFENNCELPHISNLIPGKEYALYWFDPITGEWLMDSSIRRTDENGILQINSFPNGKEISTRDWSLKLKMNK